MNITLKKIQESLYYHDAHAERYVLTSSFQDLLKPITSYVPLHTCFQWYENLSTCRELMSTNQEGSEQVSPQEGVEFLTGLYDAIDQYIKNNKEINPWSRAFLVVTMDMYAEILPYKAWTGIGEINRLLVGYEGYDQRVVVTQILRDLYLSLIMEPGAGPLGFLYLSMAVLPSEDLRSSIKGFSNLNQYFTLLGHFKNRTRPLGDEQSSLPSRCYAYLYNRIVAESEKTDKRKGGQEKAIDLITPPGSNPIEHFTPVSTRGIDPQKELKITVVGPTRSGKTTMIREFIQSYRNGVDTGFGLDMNPVGEYAGAIRYFDAHNEYPPATEETKTAINGVFRREGGESRYNFRITDTRGGLIEELPPDFQQVQDRQGLPEIDELVLETDLLVLVIPPDEIEKNSSRKAFGDILNRMENLCRILLDHKPDAMIAIVYSKCDEYGAIVHPPRRVIMERKDVMAMRQLQKSTQNWSAFVNQVTKERTGWYWGDVIKNLLNQTSNLWKSVVFTNKHANVNGYFVTAMPVDKERADIRWEERGFWEIFHDFFQHVTQTKRSVPPKKKIKPHLSAERNQIIVTWRPLSGSESSEFKIYRGASHGAMVPVGTKSAQPNKNHYVFVDSDIKRGSQYYYAVTSMNGSDSEGEMDVVGPVRLKAVSAPPPAAERPAIPQGLLARQEGKKAFLLNWNPNAERSVVNYEIFRGVDPEKLEPIDSVSSVETMYKDTTVQPNQQYCYAIKAVSNSGQKSGYSMACCVSLQRRVDPILYVIGITVLLLIIVFILL